MAGTGNAPQGEDRQHVFEWDARRRILRLPFVGDSNAKHLLRVLDDFAGNKFVCWPSRRTIIDAMETSLSTFERAKRLLVDEDLIIVEQRHGRSNRYTLRWAEYRERAYGDAVEGMPDGHPTPSNLAPSPCQADTPPVPDGHPTLASLTPGSLHQKPPKEEGSEASATASSSSWDEVGEALARRNVVAWKMAIEVAQSNGLNPSQVHEIIEVYDVVGEPRNRVGYDTERLLKPNQLFARLKHAHPASAATECWPVDFDVGRRFERRTRAEAEHAAS